MEVETKPIRFLRQSTRNLLKLSRRNHRDEASDSHRDFSSITNTTTVVSIASKLKTKSAITAEELHLLKNALLDDEGHIETVLSTHGALRGLVREISGHDIQKQCEATGCLTNLALADDRGSMAVATAAGPYLVVCLDSLSNELAVASAWALGNLAASSKKVCRLLTEQGALAKLIDVTHNTRNSEVLDSALYALNHFVDQLKEELRPQHMQKILQALALLKDNSKTASHILFSLSCHDSFLSMQEVDDQLVTKLLQQLYYIEKQELEDTWRSSRRQRKKEREAKIWEEFVKEQDQDIVSTVCQNDPYQFLDQLPEPIIREMMNSELEKMLLERESHENIKNQTQHGDGDSAKEATIHTVSFVAPDDTTSAVFHIFDDEGSERSGPEDELMEAGPETPDTVRERETEHEDSGGEQQFPLDQPPLGKPQNVTNLIENSIYCAKVKELRNKLNEELKSLTITLENKFFINVEPEALNKMKKRSTEFCTRFNRIHIYQLKRQIHDIERHSSQSLPFAKHTQFQSQVTRIISLHQNLLHAIQVFHKAFGGTCCLRDSVSVLQELAQAVRDAGCASASVAAPAATPSVPRLYDDEIPATVDKLGSTISEYQLRVEETLTAAETPETSSSQRTSRSKGRQKNKSSAESRLSMYSDRRSKPTRSTASKVSSSEAKVLPLNTEEQDKEKKSRRPLMRDPHEGQPKSRKVQQESDIMTLVQSIEPTPRNSPTRRSSRPPLQTPKNTTPRKPVPPQPPRTLPPIKKVPEPKRPIKTLSSPLSETTVQSPIQSELMAVHKIIQLQYNPKKDLEEGVTNEEGEGGNCADGEKKRVPETEGQCEVSQLLRRLCGGDSAGQQRNERATGAKNAQLLCVTGSSHRQPSTPELLRILEQTIQKKAPRQHFRSPSKGLDRLCLTFNIPESTAAGMFHYRTKYVQHMLASPMYANGAIGKPWEAISSVSDQIIDDLLLRCANEMELNDVIQDLYRSEIH